MGDGGSTLERKLSLLLWGLSLVLTAACAIVLWRLAQLHVNADKLIEEGRENHLAHELGFELRELRGAVEREELDRLAPLAQATRATLSRIAAPVALDPSSPGHARAEVALHHALDGELDRIGRARETGAALQASVDRALALAGELRRETLHEADRASERLAEEVHQVRLTMIGLLLATIGLLLALRSLAHRALRPLAALRQGAARFGQGDLEARISVRSEDDLGLVACAFNQMADRVSGTQRQLEAEVELRTRQFVRAARLAGLGTLAAGVAHEINNPLASIVTCAEGLERRVRDGRPDTATLLDYLQTIVGEARRAHGITTQLLDFAREDEGPSERIDPAALLREVAQRFRHRARAAGVTLALEIAPALPAIRANRASLQQVLLNLLINAVDASPREATVRLSAAPSDGQLHIEVLDQGSGIDPAHRGQIFDPFFTTKAPGEGTGLGLAVAFRLVEACGGSLDLIEDRPGTCFLVALPIDREPTA